MWSHPILKVALVLYVVWGAWHWYAGRPVTTPDGVLAAADPEQAELPAGFTARIGHWNLVARANYRITARVLSTERYRFDAIADLVPEDIAFGWGPMSANEVLKNVDITQGNRFYFWHTSRPPLPREVIAAHSANTHVIPASKAIARQLAGLRPGQVVTLSGVLVDGRRDDGLTISTSLSRTDTGAGACEVMLVAEIAP